jgi:hypothetical protein
VGATTADEGRPEDLQEAAVGNLRQVDAEFLTNAPVRVSVGALVDGPLGDVFKVVTADPSGWADWCPGFSSASRWTSPPPYGVGSQRSMRAFGTMFDETILVWQDNERWAFRVDATGMPLVKAFAEEWRFEPIGPTQTRITWTMAADAGVPTFWLRGSLRAQMTVMLRIAARRIGKLVNARA